MTRLELLKKEKEAIKKMQTLSYNLIDQCCEWYDHEIECIEKYGSPNPEVKEDSDGWIPCSERQPEKTSEYLITWTGKIGECDIRAIDIAEFDSTFGYEEWDVTHIKAIGYRDVKVVAWMEIADPWEGKE